MSSSELLRHAQAKAFEISVQAASLAKVSDILEPIDELLEILTGSKCLTTFPFAIERKQSEWTAREKAEADKVYQYLLLQAKPLTPQRLSRELSLDEEVVRSAVHVLFSNGIIAKKTGRCPTAYMVADRSVD